MKKTCKTCGKNKPISEFYSLPHTSDGLNYRCIPCQNFYNREHRRKLILEKLDPAILAKFAYAPTESRLLKFVRKIKPLASGCWRWTGSCHPDNGYPRFWFDRHDDRLAHRIAYEWTGRKIPYGLTIDHLCRNRWCVNPDHLEVVTRGENNLRGNSPWAINKRKTHCLRGHQFSKENTYLYKGMRHCRECSRIRKYQIRLSLGSK